MVLKKKTQLLLFLVLSNTKVNNGDDVFEISFKTEYSESAKIKIKRAESVTRALLDMNIAIGTTKYDFFKIYI